MSTTSSCRREEVVLCQPDKTVLMAQTPPIPANASDSSECATMSEKQFMRDHSIYSAMSSWLFAIAGATNIGVLSVLASKVLNAAEQGRPLFKSNDPKITPVMSNKKYNRIVIGMTAFGGACMAVSNWLESKKVVTEWQLGAGKLQRKVNIAENEQAASKPQAVSTTEMTARQQPKNWTASVQPKASEESKTRGV